MSAKFAKEPTAGRSLKLEQVIWAGPSWPVLVGVSVMALYLALVPIIARTWRTTGDEPHYLLAAHSLVTDLDFDLANNYEQLDYLAFYFSPEIEPQVRGYGQTGQQILTHYLGLPVIIAPAYALAGRVGVLIFQAILGGILAGITFKLAAFISRDERAALPATVFVVLSPPLLMYPYLIYPELPAALLTTLILYFTVTRKRITPGAATLVILALLLLPWLNRRFVPLAILLALFAVWVWWNPVSSLSRFRLGSLVSSSLWPILPLLTTMLSLGFLVWFNLQLNEPARADFAVPPDVTSVWLRLGRGIGWLLDRQRGLFIFAPLYILALWGGPILIRDSIKERDRRWFVLGPFVLSWGITAVAGGYWIPWELGPRFLVVGLPALASLLALAWRAYAPQIIWTGPAIFLVAVSLLNSLVILRNPELPYKSSLPLFYAEKINLPPAEFLPDLAGYSRISPPASRVVTDAGQPIWFAGAGRSTGLVEPEPLYDLPAGRYRLAWSVRTDPHLSPETELLRISIKFLGGGLLLNRVITAADLPPDGGYGDIRFSFTNPNFDRWRTPMVFHAASTGESNIWAKDVIFRPEPFYAWLLPYFYLFLFIAGGVGWWFYSSQPAGSAAGPARLPSLPGGLGWGLLLIAAAISFGYFLYQHTLDSRTYQAGDLQHFVGRPIADSEAHDGRAWLVDPAGDPPQKAIFGPFDFYDKGRYHVAFRLKLPVPVETDQAVARLQVSATAGFEPLFTQPLNPSHFSKSNLYHDFILVVHNPRRQALSFDVDYLGVAALAVDEITITRVGD